MIKSIVVGTDGSDTAKKAVKEAAELAAAVGAEINLVSAYVPVSNQRLRQEARDVPGDVQWQVTPREDVDGMLEEAEELVKQADVKSVTKHAREGDPADAILDVAEEQGADLIVVGNKGMTGAKRFVLGSVPNAIAHHAPCNVLIVRTT